MRMSAIHFPWLFASPLHCVHCWPLNAESTDAAVASLTNSRAAARIRERGWLHSTILVLLRVDFILTRTTALIPKDTDDDNQYDDGLDGSFDKAHGLS